MSFQPDAITDALGQIAGAAASLTSSGPTSNDTYMTLSLKTGYQRAMTGIDRLGRMILFQKNPKSFKLMHMSESHRRAILMANNRLYWLHRQINAALNSDRPYLAIKKIKELEKAAQMLNANLRLADATQTSDSDRASIWVGIIIFVIILVVIAAMVRK